MRWLLRSVLVLGLLALGAISCSSEASEGSDHAGKPGGRVLYQFVDEAGTVRIVDSLDAVPADRRAGVGRIELPARAAQPTRTTRDPEIVIYTTSWCGFCRKMLQELDAKGLRYANRDIERDPGARNELLKLVGSTGVPVTVVNGKVIRGYDPERLHKIVASTR